MIYQVDITLVYFLALWLNSALRFRRSGQNFWQSSFCLLGRLDSALWTQLFFSTDFGKTFGGLKRSNGMAAIPKNFNLQKLPKSTEHKSKTVSSTDMKFT